MHISTFFVENIPISDVINMIGELRVKAVDKKFPWSVLLSTVIPYTLSKKKIVLLNDIHNLYDNIRQPLIEN